MAAPGRDLRRHAPPASTSTAPQVASRSVGYPIGSSNAWRIGAYGSPAGGFFDGLIDDVRIYNRALSAAEVQTDMNLPVASPSPPAGPIHARQDSPSPTGRKPRSRCSGTRRRTTTASPATTSTWTALWLGRRPRRRSRSAGSRAGPATSSGSRRSTPTATSRHAASRAPRRSSAPRRQGSSRPTPSTTAPGTCSGTPPATATTARSRARAGQAATTAARSHSTAAPPRSTSARSAPSTRAASRSRPGSRRARARRTSPCSAAGPAAAGRCSGSTIWPATTS